MINESEEEHSEAEVSEGENEEQSSRESGDEAEALLPSLAARSSEIAENAVRARQFFIGVWRNQLETWCARIQGRLHAQVRPSQSFALTYGPVLYRNVVADRKSVV